MVQTLVEGLPAHGIALHHVNLRVSDDTADIGRWRPAKLWRVLTACVRTIVARFRHGCDTLYYVPAPGKRGALYRDWLVMLLCRPFFKHLVLHWHAYGLGEWLGARATAGERWLTHRLLGGATVALVLAPELAADARGFCPQRIAVVPNGIADPGEPNEGGHQSLHAPREVLFLGQCSRTKGLFATVDAIAKAQERAPGRFRLTVAGAFADAAEERDFHARLATLPPGLVRYLGFADRDTKRGLLRGADLFCFPTAYPHEGQPLALIEALAYAVPIITTRWRAIPGMLPATSVWFVEPDRPDQIAEALLTASGTPRATADLRQHFLAHFTRERHLEQMARALVPPVS
jgi:glycosyltransferase involved in cell wall biosynthesis